MTDPTLLLLTSLADGEKHGYGMMLDIETFSGILLGPGTLYGAITRLEKCGWIRAVGESGRRRPYAITGAGRAYLEGEVSQMDRVAKTAAQRLRPA